MSAILGLIFHAVGGFAAGSFYIPFNFIKKWSWESSWLVLSVTAWVFIPILMASLTIPNLSTVLIEAEGHTILYTFLFGIFWGIGSLTFGLSMRYLGISLGMAVSLGFCAAFGTLIPPIFDGTFGVLISTPGGLVTFSGVIVCLIGIGVCGRAGIYKEKDLDDHQAKEIIAEFNLVKGLSMAGVSGVLSACFAFGLRAGKPIAENAIEHGASSIFQYNAVLVWILLGGFITNFVWSAILSVKNKSYNNFFDKKSPRKKNILWACAGGVTWYFQFFFYGIGSTFLGEQFDFASWTLHMAFIILFSSLWGIYFKEWKGVDKKTIKTLVGGLITIVLATVLVGMGNLIDE